MSDEAKEDLVLGRLLPDVHAAYQDSVTQHGHYASTHEGYGVILEELDELWAEVKKKPNQLRWRAVYAEARDVAASAVKMMELAVEQGRVEQTRKPGGRGNRT